MYRDEIAGCSEKAYDSLSLADAKKILMFASDQELQAYVLDVSISVSASVKLFLHILFDFINLCIFSFCCCFYSTSEI